MKVLVIGGGVIPDTDIPGLKAAGVAEVLLQVLLPVISSILSTPIPTDRSR